MRLLILFLVLMAGINNSFAQEVDTVALAAKKRANRAAAMSAVLPGLGQGYNRKYWKIPVIYSGFAVLGYFATTNHKEYRNFKEAIQFRTDEDPNTTDDYPRFTNEDLVIRKDFHRRNRDLCYILAGVLYTLNIVDAYVDSHLLEFDVSDDLTLRSAPVLLPSDAGGLSAGIQFNLSFK